MLPFSGWFQGKPKDSQRVGEFPISTPHLFHLTFEVLLIVEMLPLLKGFVLVGSDVF